MIKIRTFIPLELPPIIRERLSSYRELISEHDNLKQIQWLLKENYHLTMVFLGNIETVLIKSLELKLEHNLSSSKAVPIKFSEISSFPFSDTLRIAATMLQNSNELAQFQNYVANCVRAFGIPFERRRFSPHVTHGRIKSRCRKSLVFQPKQIYLEGVSEKVFIFQSKLIRKGAIYKPLGEISLI